MGSKLSRNDEDAKGIFIPEIRRVSEEGFTKESIKRVILDHNSTPLPSNFDYESALECVDSIPEEHLRQTREAFKKLWPNW